MPKVDTRYALADAITTILTTNLQDMPEITCENCVQVHIKLKDLLKRAEALKPSQRILKYFEILEINVFPITPQPHSERCSGNIKKQFVELIDLY